MFNLGEIIPINFYIEADRKYTNSIILLTLVNFEANSSGRQPNIVVLIDNALCNLKYTIEKSRKQHISKFKER